MKRLFLAALVLLTVSTARAEFDVADNYRPLRYLGSEGTSGSTVFDVTWPFEDESDLVVRVSTDAGLTWTTKTLSTHYTVAGENTDSGTITFGTALAAGDVVMIERNDPLARTEDIATLTPSRVNLEFDRQMVQYQQAEELAEKRAIQTLFANDYDDICGNDVDFDNVLPLIDRSRRGRAIVAKPNGCGVTLSDSSLGDWDCLKCPGGGGGGSCEGGTNAGEQCLTNTDCAGGGTCNPGTCDGGTNDGDPCYIDEDCPGGECDPGLCVGGTADGDPCDTDDECPGGYCDGGADFENCEYLSTDAEGTLVCGDGCPDSCSGAGGGGCLDCSDIGTCSGGDNDGKPCNSADDCPGGECIPDPDDVCQGGDNDGDPCTDDADCPGGGRCTPNVDTCFGGANDGDPCTDDTDCPDGVCLGPGDVCEGGTNDGDPCQDDTDCPGGFCARCSVCYGSASDGQPCDTDNADCGGGDGICISCDSGEVCIGGTGDGNPCTDDADCAGGGTCDTRDGVGVLSTGTVENNAVALFDGTSGEFIRAGRVRITTNGSITGAFGLWMNTTVSNDATQSIAIMYPGLSNQAAREEAAAIYNWPRISPESLAADVGFPQNTQFAWSAASPDHDTTDGARTTTHWAPSTYPIAVFQPGVSTNSQLVARIYFTEPVVCPDDWAGSEVWNATAFTSSATYNLQKNGSTVGTAVFDTDAGPNEAALLTSGGITTFAAGDYLDIDAPASADATGANLSFSLLCYRSISDEMAR